MKSLDRRSMFKMMAASVLALPFMTKVAFAQDKKCGVPGEKASAKLIDDKTAKRLDYVAVAGEAKGNPKYKAGDHCSSCNFYKAPEGDYGKCSMAGMRYVAGCGWCKMIKVKA